MTQWKLALKKRVVILQSGQLNRSKCLALKAIASTVAEWKAALYTRRTVPTHFGEKWQFSFHPFFQFLIQLIKSIYWNQTKIISSTLQTVSQKNRILIQVKWIKNWGKQDQRFTCSSQTHNSQQNTSHGTTLLLQEQKNAHTRIWLGLKLASSWNKSRIIRYVVYPNLPYLVTKAGTFSTSV